MQSQVQLPSVRVPFRSTLDFEVWRKHSNISNPEEPQISPKDNEIVFTYKSDSDQGEKIVVTFNGEGHLRIQNDGESLILASEFGNRISILTHV